MALNYSLPVSTFPPGHNTSDDYLAGASEDDDAALPTVGLPSFRIIISTVYLLVCAVGLLGNFFVMYLIWAKRFPALSAIDVFVFCLALTDFQFAITLPFWAVEAILDFSWPFGKPMCKIVLTITILNVYNNIFLLSAMAITRYWSVASALSPRCRVSTTSAKWISLALWVFAIVATIPAMVFATTVNVLEDELCLLKFPSNKWLATYHLQRVIIGFVIPLVMIASSYLMLLNFLRQHKVNANNRQRQSKITSSIQLVVIVFFVCWFPNLAVTFWGVLIKYELVHWSSKYYFIHTYIFPITSCLAHSNSCLNPVLYCLMRKEFRKALKATFWRLSTLASSYLPSAPRERVNMEQDTTMPLYRRTSFPHTGSKDYAITSLTAITVLQDLPIKDQNQPNPEPRGQDSMLESIPSDPAQCREAHLPR